MYVLSNRPKRAIEKEIGQLFWKICTFGFIGKSVQRIDFNQKYFWRCKDSIMD